MGVFDGIEAPTQSPSAGGVFSGIKATPPVAKPGVFASVGTTPPKTTPEQAPKVPTTTPYFSYGSADFLSPLAGKTQTSTAPTVNENPGGGGLISGILDQYKNPSATEQATEKNIVAPKPNTGNKALDAILAPGTNVAQFIQKAAIRTLEPGLEPLGEDAGQQLALNEEAGVKPSFPGQLIPRDSQIAAVQQKIKDGTLPPSSLDDLDTLKKTAPQVFGDVAQALFTLSTPSIFGHGIESIGSKGLAGALAAGTLHGTEAGAAFGVAQALSSGSTDPGTLAGIVTKSAAGGALLGLVTSGVIKTTPEIVKKAQDVAAYIKAHPELQQGKIHIPGLGDLPEEGDKVEGALTPYDTKEIVDAREAQKNTPPTSDIQTPERQALRQKIVDDTYGNGALNKEKRLDIVTGGPATGKSSKIVEPLAKAHGSIIADSDLIKEKLPEFGEGNGAMNVHRESAILNKQVMDRAMANGDNIVWPHVGESDASLQKIIPRFKEAGYDVHLHHAEAPLEKTLPRLVDRFNKTGRFVDPDYAYNTVGLRPNEVNATIKSHEGLTSQSRYSTDVGREEAPVLLERSGEGHERLPASLSRVDERGSEQKPEQVRSGTHGREGTNPTPRIQRSRAELEQEIEDLKGYLDYTDEMVKDHPAKGLLKYFGSHKPSDITLDDILARNVEKKTGAKSSQLDSIVTEHGYETPQDAQRGVVEYMKLRDQNKALHEQMSSLQGELKTVTDREEKEKSDDRAAARASAKTETHRREAQSTYEKEQRIEAVKENAAPKNLGLTRQVITDKNGNERLTADLLANPSNFYQRMAEIKKGDPERSLNGMHHISREDVDAAIQRARDRQAAAEAKSKAINIARHELPYSLGLWEKIKRALYPISSIKDIETRKIATDWQHGELSAVEMANKERERIPGATWKVKSDGTKELVKKSPLETRMPTDEAIQYYTALQHGKYTPMRALYDKAYHMAEALGLDVPYRKDYVPQVYKEKMPEVKVAVIQYMRDHGVDQDVAEAYVQGAMELPYDVALRLKVNPFFEEHKVFPDYSAAAKYQLHPKFTSEGDLYTNYMYEMYKTLNNKQFVGKLIDGGKLLPAGLAPKHWEHVTTNFVHGDLYAPPELASMLNDYYKDQASMGVFDTAVHYLGLASRKAQEIALSGAIPYTNIHFFSMGQLIKEMTAGNFKAIGPFVRANSLGATERWYRDNQIYSTMMARQGIDISSRMGSIKQIYNSLSHDATWKDKVGIEFHKAFLDKSFGTFLPSLYLQVFKDTYLGALQKGMDEATAEKFAGEVTQKNFGLLGSEARAGSTKDSLSGVFFAPQFRESIFGTLTNAAKSVSTEWNNPAFYRNRNLVAGMVLSFGMYQVFNKMLNGQYTWQNPPGHEFEMRVPLADGNNMYIPFMPSYLAVPRSLASGSIAAAKGDVGTATQQAGNLFALPLQVAIQMIANKDYFGQPIYKTTDSAPTVYGKLGAYLGLEINHPYVRAVADMIMKHQPIYQTLSEATTLPLKFQSDKSINQGQFYDALAASQQKNADAKPQTVATYNQVQQLLAQGDNAGATKITQSLTPQEYADYKNYKAAQKTATTDKEKATQFGQYQEIQQLVKEGKVAEATQLTKSMTPEEYRIYGLLKKQFGDATNPQ